MGFSNLELVIQCDNFPYFEDNQTVYAEHIAKYYEFRVSGIDATLGYILNSVVDKFPWPQYWQIDSRLKRVTLVTAANVTAADRSKLIAETLSEAVKKESFEVLKGWRSENYPVFGPGGEYLFEMERSASPLFGIVTYGSHMTGYTEDAEGMKIWVPRRSKNKQTYPGMLDNTVAGGMATGERPFECIVREALEEASLPESVVRPGAIARGCITYSHIRDARAGGEVGLSQPEIEFVYDLKLDASVTPKPGDNEVDAFELLSIPELKDALARGEFKPNCSVVIIDFFIRHGILTPENEPDYLDIMSRLHRRLQYPLASYRQ
ncbi:hypothetical protein N7468_001303 [Penicillium chermesinum]|uniref:Nudix hydrolase domain-containing protein n=1 Tax=Penicillium chermesinum TaxID=63820 RepID=A0A9W9PGF9_9EURO|nr:uncharacterized protein N7468_001303 [Penicillium chermesinum]KAJ5246320.1 hypothetical protein N7468_001303 [Penicillium chermesinum]